jgi:hypothetical protein
LARERAKYLLLFSNGKAAVGSRKNSISVAFLEQKGDEKTTNMEISETTTPKGGSGLYPAYIA